MSKRLVKTAKQQFEERLCSMKEYGSYSPEAGDVFHGCEDHDGKLVILRENEGNYVELKYAQSYADLVESEDFLKAMTERALEVGISVKKLFDWYASADRDIDAFDWEDIWRVDLEETSVEFEDIYEEVPDVKVVTAKEQWERESEGSEVIQALANGSVYKVAITDASITFFVCQDGGEPFKEVYPSFEELRKDVKFVTAYLSHVMATHDKDVDAALAWLQGGEYSMSKVSLLDIYECAECIDHLCYHDKEEEPVKKQDFSKELDELRKKMIAHIGQLCEQGMTVEAEVLCQNPFLLWEDKCYTPTEGIKDCWVMKNDKNEWRFLYDYDGEGQYDYGLDEFSVEGLRHIIESLQ